jgi:hypothetical protein
MLTLMLRGHDLRFALVDLPEGSRRPPWSTCLKALGGLASSAAAAGSAAAPDQVARL